MLNNQSIGKSEIYIKEHVDEYQMFKERREMDINESKLGKKVQNKKIYTVSKVYLHIISLNWKVPNKWIESEVLAERIAFMLIGESGKSIFEISIRKYDTCLTEIDQIYKTSLIKNEFTYGEVMT